MFGSSMVQSFSSLWGIFLRIMKDPKAGSLYVILDALDECEQVSCHQLLESISDMLAESLHTTRSDTTVKFLITSRLFLHQSYANTKEPLQSQISIDDGQIGYVEDLEKFIREQVDNISLNRRYSSDVREYLFQTMISKVDRTFLWTHVVLASVEKSFLTSTKDFQKIIASIPEDLANTYKRYLSAIRSGHQDDASHLLKLLLASSRPLNLDELNIAFTMDSSHVTTEDVMGDPQNAIAHTVQGILGPLVRVSGPQVSLVHQPVKEFLLEQVAGKYESFPGMRTVDAKSSALRLATVCIQYLLLDDFKNDLFSTITSSAESSFQIPRLLDELPMGDFTGDFWDEEDHNLNSDVLFHEENELDPEVCLSLTSNYGFYSYASLHWADHFAVCEDSASDQLRNAAKSLLDVTTGSCRNWLHFYRTEAVTLIDYNLGDQNPVVLAAQFNLHAMLKDLLGNSEYAQPIKNRSLYWASLLGHDRIVASLLTAGAEPDSEELERQTALTAASEHGNLGCVVTLLADKRININEEDIDGWTPLAWAIQTDSPRTVQALINDESVQIERRDFAGRTPLYWAVEYGHASIVKVLLQAGADPEAESKRDTSLNGLTIPSSTPTHGIPEPIPVSDPSIRVLSSSSPIVSFEPETKAPFEAIRRLFDHLKANPEMESSLNATYPMRGIFKMAATYNAASDQKFTIDLSPTRNAKIPDSLWDALAGAGFNEILNFFDNVNDTYVAPVLSPLSSLAGADLHQAHKSGNINYRLCDYSTDTADPESDNGCGAHTDYGTFSITFQDGTPGLEMEDAEHPDPWVPVPGDATVVLASWCAAVCCSFVAPDLDVKLKPLDGAQITRPLSQRIMTGEER
ncbi:hypothetical protein QQX98_008644 [Neonectria punicea]|uniref:Nephrocystin 3-like N-terminal domain-containing protein n=1 Tax=Neonectria punicea TaxID=979145 RepID=A0ABR1GUW1_9HYPO